MLKRDSDAVFHPPSGSNLPGKVDPNPYVYYPPNSLRKMIKEEGDWEERDKMIRALKQWARIYTYPGYPWRLARAIRMVANNIRKLAEKNPPAINLPYYQDVEVSQGLEEIMDSLKGLYDNDDQQKFDYTRQGERPVVDINKGDFLSPSEPPMGDVVKEKGDGPDPEGMEVPEPPTGGDMARI